MQKYEKRIIPQKCGLKLCYSTAKVFNRKDGSGKIVCIRHEIALQPGMAILEVYPDPKDGKVKLDGDRVVEFPKLPEMQQVTYKVLRFEERDKGLVIKEAQMVA
ncbi:MAG: hypothetical protein ACREFR_03075 [Limisphaerales bacterium]